MIGSRFLIASLGDGSDGFLPSLRGCVVEVFEENEGALKIRIADNSHATAAIPPRVGDDHWSMPRSYIGKGIAMPVG